MSLDQEFETIKQFNNDNINTLFSHLDNSNILDYRKNKNYEYGSDDHFEFLKKNLSMAEISRLKKGNYLSLILHYILQ